MGPYFEVLRDQLTCPACKVLGLCNTRFDDYRNGNRVCMTCGLVDRDYIIDDRAEWRTFADKENKDSDPSRGKGNKQFDGVNCTQQQFNVQHEGPHFRREFQDIKNLTDKLQLSEAVRTEACGIYKEVLESGAVKQYSKTIVQAAVVLWGCKRQGVDVTIKELCCAADLPEQKQFNTVYNRVEQYYKGRALTAAKTGASPKLVGALSAGRKADGVSSPQMIVKRFMCRLGADRRLAMLGWRAAELEAKLVNTQDVPWGGKPDAMRISGLIYGLFIIANLKDPSILVPSLQEVAEVTGMAPATIWQVFKEMKPYLIMPGKLVEKKDAPPDVLARLEDYCSANCKTPSRTPSKAPQKTPSRTPANNTKTEATPKCAAKTPMAPVLPSSPHSQMSPVYQWSPIVKSPMIHPPMSPVSPDYHTPTTPDLPTSGKPPTSTQKKTVQGMKGRVLRF